MLRTLNIQNIALISQLSIDFEEGLTVLSGETGSGKSIIIDSLAFVLGERADKSMIKHGADKASVEVVFDIESDSDTAYQMQAIGIEFDNTLIINRTLTIQGRNECRINGKICTTAMLKSITSTLVDIFGQSQHLNLLKTDNHLSIIDAFTNFGELKTELLTAHRRIKEIDKQLQQFGGSPDERERLLDILAFQINELKEANLSVEEESELLEMHKKVVNIEKIANALSQCNYTLSESEQSMTSLCANAIYNLEQVANFDSNAESLSQRMKQIKIELQDIADSVRDMAENTDYDPYKVNQMESRLEKIRTIKRKYGGSVEDALQFLAKAEKQHNELANATALIEQLSKERLSLGQFMYSLSQKVSQLRQHTAQKFSQDIMSQLADLGMKGTTFEVQFEKAPDCDTYCVNPTPNGYDKLEFMMSANVGQPLRPLVKVISGGEMSRFMLAVKNITAHAENIPTMVFDEIDTGISGNVALKVAMKLAQVSREYQCIVITHLPQIVAIADNNIVISKYSDEDSTISKVEVLVDKVKKAEEVARLTGGVSKTSVTNAMEMLDWSQEYKNNLA